MTFHMVAMRSSFWLLLMAFATTADLYTPGQDGNRYYFTRYGSEQDRDKCPRCDRGNGYDNLGYGLAPGSGRPLGGQPGGWDSRAPPTGSHAAGLGVMSTLMYKGWDNRNGGGSTGWASAGRWPERPAGGAGDRDGRWEDRGTSGSRWDDRGASVPGGRPGWNSWGSRGDDRGAPGGGKWQDRGPVGGGRWEERYPTGAGRWDDRGSAGGGRWDERGVGSVGGGRWDERPSVGGGRWDERNPIGSGRWDERGVVGSGRWDERRPAGGSRWDDRGAGSGGRWDERNPSGSGRWDERGAVGGGRWDDRLPAGGSRWDDRGVGSGGKWDGRGGVGDGRGGSSDWNRVYASGWDYGHGAARPTHHEGGAGSGSWNEHSGTGIYLILCPITLDTLLTNGSSRPCNPPRVDYKEYHYGDGTGENRDRGQQHHAQPWPTSYLSYLYDRNTSAAELGSGETSSPPPAHGGKGAAPDTAAASSSKT